MNYFEKLKAVGFPLSKWSGDLVAFWSGACLRRQKRGPFKCLHPPDPLSPGLGETSLPQARHGLSTSPTRGHQQGVWNLIFPGYILILNKIPLAVYHFKN